MKALVAAAVAALIILSCGGSDECTPKATRCLKHTAEICDAAKHWQELANCDLVSEQSGAAFVCAYVEEQTDEGTVAGHTCVPAEDVLSDGGRP